MMVMETERYILDEKGVLTFKDNVTMIMEEEFKGRDDINKVILPGTVDSIGIFAFCGCKALREVVMEEGVRWIWDGAFRSCYKLKVIQLPASLEFICSYAFAYCTGLKKAVIPSNTWIYDHVFEGCDALEKVIIRDVKQSATAK